MRKVTGDILSVRYQIHDLIGEKLDILLNPGRNKISSHQGSIGEIYPSLFTLNVSDAEGQTEKKITCSYSDVLCGKVSLKKNDNE